MECSEKTAWMSIGTNVTLIAIKIGLTIKTGSLAIKADVHHSVSDVISSVTILCGIKISNRSAEI